MAWSTSRTVRRMNNTKFMQTDARWGGMLYPRKPYYIRNCGCGEVSIANIIIEMNQYLNYTPATIQPYCKQYAEPCGNGTYHSGIPKMMEHYGLTEVKEHATMSTLWTELAKGGRVAIYLMGSKPAGKNKVRWTSGGHYVASVDFKYVGDEPYVYMKDSYSNSSSRNGWISYTGNLRGSVYKVWSGKLNNKLIVDGDGGTATVKRMQQFFGTEEDGVISGQNAELKKYYPSLTAVNFGTVGSACVRKLQKWLGLEQTGIIDKATVQAWQTKLGVEADGFFGKGSMKAWQKYLNEHDHAEYPVIKTKPQLAVEYGEALAKDNSYHYVSYNTKDAKTKECPICHKFPNGKYKGFNCIRFVFSCWYHVGIPCKHEGGLINNAIGDKMYTASESEMLKLAQDAIGCKDIKVIRNKNGIPQSQLQVGDACLHYDGTTYTHIFLYAGGGKMVDCGNWKNQADQIKVRTAQSSKVLVRYTGK